MVLFIFRRMLFPLCLLLFSATLLAGVKNYAVTSPDGVTLAVQESGNPNGRPVIFIHGLLGSHLNWEKQVEDAQLQHYRLITFDLRGHGLSDKPGQEAAYGEGKRWGDDLAAIIEGTHADHPLLVGWSLGGVVITRYLEEYGDARISGAVYVDGVVELTPEQITAHPDVYRDMTAGDLKTHLDGERAFLRLCFYQQPDRVTFERLLANAALAAWPMQRAVPSIRVSLEKSLKPARVPLLFIYGKHDALVNPQASLARAKAMNPRIQSLIFDNAGHAPFIEDAERFNRVLNGFIEKL